MSDGDEALFPSSICTSTSILSLGVIGCFGLALDRPRPVQPFRERDLCKEGNGWPVSIWPKRWFFRKEALSDR